jgi:hypothetical protein
MPVSRAKLFYDEECSDFASFQALINEQAEENEWREFKGAEFIDAPLPPQGTQEKGRNSDPKKTWSENLSAFANTGGGVLIWGIRAPRRKAKSLSLAHDANALSDRLKELQNDAADPPVPGVEIRAILAPTSKQGLVICYIPPSKFSPHRAKWAEREYYIRIGDSNREIPTALLRRLFYPERFPWLIPQATAQLTPENDGLRLGMGVSIRNGGVASAQETCIRINADLNGPPRIHEFHDYWKKRPYSDSCFICKITIHPGETVGFLNNVTTAVGFPGPIDENMTFTVGFDLYSLNAPALLAEVSFTAKELMSTSSVKRDAVVSPPDVSDS